jgi:hypothetical protein
LISNCMAPANWNQFRVQELAFASTNNAPL